MVRSNCAWTKQNTNTAESTFRVGEENWQPARRVMLWLSRETKITLIRCMHRLERYMSIILHFSAAA